MLHKNIDYSFEIITYWINCFNKRFESQMSTLLYMTYWLLNHLWFKNRLQSIVLNCPVVQHWGGGGGFKGELASDYFLHTKILIALNLRELIIESIIPISDFLKCPLGHIWFDWLTKPWMIQKSLLWTPSHMNTFSHLQMKGLSQVRIRLKAYYGNTLLHFITTDISTESDVGKCNFSPY